MNESEPWKQTFTDRWSEHSPMPLQLIKATHADHKLLNKSDIMLQVCSIMHVRSPPPYKDCRIKVLFPERAPEEHAILSRTECWILPPAPLVAFVWLSQKWCCLVLIRNNPDPTPGTSSFTRTRGADIYSKHSQGRLLQCFAGNFLWVFLIWTQCLALEKSL